MHVRVLLFARPKEVVGAPSVAVDIDATHGAVTVASVRAALAAAHPRLAPLLPSCRLAVAQELADESAVVPDGAEVALLPPVSGG